MERQAESLQRLRGGGSGVDRTASRSSGCQPALVQDELRLLQISVFEIPEDRRHVGGTRPNDQRHRPDGRSLTASSVTFSRSSSFTISPFYSLLMIRFLNCDYTHWCTLLKSIGFFTLPQPLDAVNKFLCSVFPRITNTVAVIAIDSTTGALDAVRSHGSHFFSVRYGQFWILRHSRCASSRRNFLN